MPYVILVLLLVGVVTAAVSGGAVAQSRSHLVLVVPPLPRDPIDSAFALQLAEELRKRVRAWDRRVVTYRDMCQMLRASDLSCRKLMRGDEASQLAAALGADAYITGSFIREPNVVLRVRVTSRTRVGYAGSIELYADRGLDADSIVALANEGLDALWIAGALARRCYDARDAGDFDEAVFYAEGARSVVPNHSVALLCLATVYELTDQPVVTLINTYAQALLSDPSLVDTRRRLVSLYLELGDTLGANLLMAQELRENPGNQSLRARVLFNWVRVGEPDSAFRTLRADGDSQEENLNLLRIISRACLEREMFSCEYEALGRQYTIDPSLVGDTTFYYRIVGAAQSLDDANGVLLWTTEGIHQVRQTLGRESDPGARRSLRALRMAHAGALTSAGNRDSAVAVYLQLEREDSTDVRPRLAAAEALVNPRFLGIDSMTPLDTAALRKADSMLVALARGRDDEALLQTIATIYFTPAAALVRGRVAPELASAWLQKAMSFDVDGRIHEIANALNGLALSLVVQQLDARIREQPACDLVDQTAETIARAREATLAGQGALPDVARQVLQGLEGYERFIPQYRDILQCKSSSPNFHRATASIRPLAAYYQAKTS